MSAWGNGGWKDWGTGEWTDNKNNKPMNMADNEGWIDFNKNKEADEQTQDQNNYQKGGVRLKCFSAQGGILSPILKYAFTAISEMAKIAPWAD